MLCKRALNLTWFDSTNKWTVLQALSVNLTLPEKNTPPWFFWDYGGFGKKSETAEIPPPFPGAQRRKNMPIFRLFSWSKPIFGGKWCTQMEGNPKVFRIERWKNNVVTPNLNEIKLTIGVHDLWKEKSLLVNRVILNLVWTQKTLSSQLSCSETREKSPLPFFRQKNAALERGKFTPWACR